MLCADQKICMKKKGRGGGLKSHQKKKKSLILRKLQYQRKILMAGLFKQEELGRGCLSVLFND